MAKQQAIEFTTPFPTEVVQDGAPTAEEARQSRRRITRWAAVLLLGAGAATAASDQSEIAAYANAQLHPMTCVTLEDVAGPSPNASEFAKQLYGPEATKDFPYVSDIAGKMGKEYDGFMDAREWGGPIIKATEVCAPPPTDWLVGRYSPEDITVHLIAG